MKNYISIAILLLLFNYAQSQDAMLCVGHHWSEDQGNLMLKQFASEWDDRSSWDTRALQIKKQIIDGMQLEKMPDTKGNFNTILRNKREMDGYTVENIAIESFPGSGSGAVSL